MAYDWNFTLNPGKLHKGGTLRLRFGDDLSQDEIEMEIEYDIKIKGLVPIPGKFKKGNYSFDVPSSILKPDLWESLKSTNEEQKVEKVIFKYHGEESGQDVFHLNFKDFITGFLRFDVGSMNDGPSTLEVSVSKIPVAGDYTLSLERI